MVKLSIALLIASVCPGVFAQSPGERSLSYDDRVQAQEAIEGIDGRRRVDVARMLELQAYWDIVPTGEMLDRELVRLTRDITPPELLAKICGVLGNDPFLIRECLARPALVDRLSRDRYAFDPSLHSRERAEAVELRRQLVSLELSPWADHPGRSVIELPPGQYEGGGQASAIQEERDGFVINVVLSETRRAVRMARYVIPKTTFDAWWRTGRTATASAPDLFSVCATSGEAIALRVEEGALQPAGAAPSEAHLLDATGEPLAQTDDSWTAPYTGAYLVQVERDATATPDDYLLLVGAPGTAPVDQLADLDVTTTDDPDPAGSGGLLTHTIVMHNAGPGAALDAEMLFLLPEFTTFEAITFPPAGDDPWRCTVPRVGGKGKVSCASKCFAPGAAATFSVTSRVDECLGNTDLASKTTASSATPDLNTANNSVVASTAVIDPGTCDDGDVCTAGDQCGPGVGLQQDFDGVSVPFLPAGWTATLVIGPVGAAAWRTVASNFDTEPNAAFVVDAPEIRDAVLDSPPIAIESANAQLRFRNRFDLELLNDGGVLEIKIGNGPFVDILDAGGSFVEGGYSGTIRQGFASPIAGRQAWTGRQSTYMTTTVNLPPAAAGQSVVLRWRLATDLSLGNVGQWIDSIFVSSRNVCHPGTQSACDDNDPCTADACDPLLGCANVRFSCDDGDLCTDDLCDPVLHCIHTNNTAPCDDGSACTLTDLCAAGACVGTTAVVCHDADLCTADSCDPAVQCVSTTADLDGSGFSAGRVDGRDLAVLADAWNSCSGSPRYAAAANFDRQDACIGLTDFHLFMDAFGRNCPL
jgi:hypothetical protein